MTKQRRKLQVHIADESTLASAYMPFIKNGGLFIGARKGLRMGDDVLLQLRLLDAGEALQIESRVVWLSPQSGKGDSQQGVGLAFHENADRARVRIEDLLAANKDVEFATFTI